jgi:hypothetical protein
MDSPSRPRPGPAPSDTGLRPWGRPLCWVDSITEAASHGSGEVVVSGSHGGLSAARYALQARPHLVVFNDAGIGKDGAGIAALDWLQQHGVAALAVAHHSARIGEAASTWQDGLISAANEAAQALGARAGQPLQGWLRSVSREAGVSGW